MNSFQTLYRRTAAILSAIAALTATGLATAQVVTLSGTSSSSCTFSLMTVQPNGNVSVTCASSSSPGVFTLTAPTSLSTNSSSVGSEVRVNRASGSVGDVTVGFTFSGASNCSSAASSVTFADLDQAAKTITVDTNTLTGSCIVALSAPSAGTLGSPSSKTISVVDPDAPVVFAFAANNPLSAAVGSGAVQVVVTRTGGRNNLWTVPVILSGGLTSGGSLLAGTASPSVLSFAAGSSQAVITFAPPSATPASPTLPASVTFTLGTPNSTTNPPGQTGSIGDGTHTLTLNGPAVGCPVPETSATNLGSAGNTQLLKSVSGAVVTFNLPTPTGTLTTGTFKLSESPYASPVSPWSYEIHINKCKGMVQPSTTDRCYAKSSNMTLFTKYWFTRLLAAPWDTPAKIAANGYCYAPSSEGPWYVNVRYNYAGCGASAGVCGWNRSWSNWVY